VLSNGDAAAPIKDLRGKGSSITLKMGTQVKKHPDRRRRSRDRLQDQRGQFHAHRVLSQESVTSRTHRRRTRLSLPFAARAPTDDLPTRIDRARSVGYRNLPGVTIDAVEINPDVIALRDVFRIPADDDPPLPAHAGRLGGLCRCPMR